MIRGVIGNTSGFDPEDCRFEPCRISFHENHSTNSIPTKYKNIMSELQIDQIKNFFAYATERYEIMLKRRQGMSAPWTNDPILSAYRFCNVFREDDVVTEFMRDNVRVPFADSKHLLPAIMTARWFNFPNSVKKLLDLFGENWNSNEARTRLENASQLVSGAYIIKTPTGLNKLDGILQCVDWAYQDGILELGKEMREREDFSLEEATERLTEFRFLGKFMAYEIVTDLRHTPLLNTAPDILTWANPGPGATRGLCRMTCQDLDSLNRSSSSDVARMMNYMQELLEYSKDSNYWSSDYPSWEMREVEHTLCEFDKYSRVLNGEGRPKQTYKPKQTTNAIF